MGLTLDVFVNGARSAVLSERWRSLSIVDGIDYQADRATLVLSVTRSSAVRIPPLGVELRFAADGRDLGAPLRVSSVQGDNRAGSLTVEAAALHPRTTLRQPRTASWSGRSIAEIAGSIARRAGLVPAVSGSLGNIRPAGAIQSAESDIQFLRRLVSRLNGRVIPKKDRLTVLAAGADEAASGSALPALEVDLRAAGAWTRWRRSEAAIVDVVQTRYLKEDGATPEFLELGEGREGQRVVRREIPGVYASKQDAEAACSRVLGSARSGFDFIEIVVSLTPSARALYPIILSGVPDGFPTRLAIHQVRHKLGQRVATTTITARPSVFSG